MPQLKIDLHVHTDYSDSTGELDSIVRTALKKGLDGIAITDHDTCEAAVLAMERYSDRFVVVPGLELKTEEGHLLALGLAEAPSVWLGALNAAKFIHERGALVVVPHPKVPFLGFHEEALGYLKPDAIEVRNAATPFYNWVSNRNLGLAKKFRLPQTGGSDAHMSSCVGDSYTIIDSDSRELADIIRAIRDGRTTPAGNPSPILYRMRMLLAIF